MLKLEPGELTARVAELAEQEHEIPYSRRLTVSEATLWRLLQAYRKDGLEGLYRKPRRDAGRARILPPHIFRRALEIRQDLRSSWNVRRVHLGDRFSIRSDTRAELIRPKFSTR